MAVNQQLKLIRHIRDLQLRIEDLEHEHEQNEKDILKTVRNYLFRKDKLKTNLEKLKQLRMELVNAKINLNLLEQTEPTKRSEEQFRQLMGLYEEKLELQTRELHHLEIRGGGLEGFIYIRRLKRAIEDTQIRLEQAGYDVLMSIDY